MTNDNDKSGSPLHPTKISADQLKIELDKRLTDLKDQLDDLNYCYRFFLHAIEALTRPDRDVIESSDWHLGLWLTGLWIDNRYEDQLQQIVKLLEWVDIVVITKD